MLSAAIRLMFAGAVTLAACSKSESESPPANEPSAPSAVNPPAKEAPPPREPPRSTAKDPAAARAMIEQGAVVIDVRTTEEYADDHLASAVNIPVQDLPARLAEVEKLVGGDKSRPVVLYCGTGNRAGKAKAQLDAAGYTNVVNGGGLDDVRE